MQIILLETTFSIIFVYGFLCFSFSCSVIAGVAIVAAATVVSLLYTKNRSAQKVILRNGISLVHENKIHFFFLQNTGLIIILNFQSVSSTK